MHYSYPLCDDVSELQMKDGDFGSMPLIAGENMLHLGTERTTKIVKRASPHASPIKTDVCIELSGLPRPNPRSSRLACQGIYNWSSSGTHAVPVLPQPEIPQSVSPNSASELIFGISTWKEEEN